jgi:uncharacterized membrane protein
VEAHQQPETVTCSSFTVIIIVIVFLVVVIIIVIVIILSSRENQRSISIASEICEEIGRRQVSYDQ